MIKPYLSLKKSLYSLLSQIRIFNSKILLCCEFFTLNKTYGENDEKILFREEHDSFWL